MLASECRFGPVPERKVHVCNGRVEHRLMPSVDGQRTSFVQEAEGAVGVTPSGREHCPSARHAKMTDRKSLADCMTDEHGLGLGPAAETGDRFSGQSVEVTAEATIETGELSFGNGIKRRVDRHLISARIDQRNAQIDGGQSAGLRVRGSGNGLSTQFHRLVRVALIAAHDAQDATGHHPKPPGRRRGLGGRRRPSHTSAAPTHSGQTSTPLGQARRTQRQSLCFRHPTVMLPPVRTRRDSRRGTR